MSEISLPEKDKYRVILLICGILKNGTSELIYKIELTDVANKLLVTKEERGGGISWEVETDMYTSLCI